jgi:hypothetical protein
MAMVGGTAMVLALWRPVLFLAFIAVFSFYFAFRGYRVLSHKRPLQGQGPSAIDWVAAVLSFFGSVALIVLGILQPNPVWVQLSVVAIVFGVIGVALASSDIWRFMRATSENGPRRMKVLAVPFEHPSVHVTNHDLVPAGAVVVLDRTAVWPFHGSTALLDLANERDEMGARFQKKELPFVRRNAPRELDHDLLGPRRVGRRCVEVDSVAPRLRPL